MCEIKLDESMNVISNGLHLTTEKSVECFRVFAEYQTQDSPTKRNVLGKLKEWIKNEEAQLDDEKFNSALPPINSAMDAICPHCGKDDPIGTYTELDTVSGTKIFCCGNCKRLYEGIRHQ
jgi:hypothetical protein